MLVRSRHGAIVRGTMDTYADIPTVFESIGGVLCCGWPSNRFLTVRWWIVGRDAQLFGGRVYPDDGYLSKLHKCPGGGLRDDVVVSRRGPNWQHRCYRFRVLVSVMKRGIFKWRNLRPRSITKCPSCLVTAHLEHRPSKYQTQGIRISAGDWARILVHHPPPPPMILHRGVHLAHAVGVGTTSRANHHYTTYGRIPRKKSNVKPVNTQQASAKIFAMKCLCACSIGGGYTSSTAASFSRFVPRRGSHCANPPFRGTRQRRRSPKDWLCMNACIVRIERRNGESHRHHQSVQRWRSSGPRDFFCPLLFRRCPP